MSEILGGLDIGGTKCAVVLGREAGDTIEIIAKRSFPTPSNPEAALRLLGSTMETLLAEHKSSVLKAIGISCGGPLDSHKGWVLSPPNLPGWDQIDVVSPFRERFGVPVSIQNDANACALAEWKWGAGRGTRNMIFLTFGTGMGAGLILNGQLYSGTNDMAGEVGHMRLEESGPVGYGKEGSFEGFCSGGGMTKLAGRMLKDWTEAGRVSLLSNNKETHASELTALNIFEAAEAGDELALLVLKQVGQKLGKGLAILVDVLNPERIIIGSIYARKERLLAPTMLEVLEQEALPRSLAVCEIVPSGLRENVGDAASLSVALHALQIERAGGAL